jgi:hypothetical protein
MAKWFGPTGECNCECGECDEVICSGMTTVNPTGYEVVNVGLPTDGDFFFIHLGLWYKVTLPGFATAFNGTFFLPRQSNCDFTTDSSSVLFEDATITEYADDAGCPDFSGPSTSTLYDINVFFRLSSLPTSHQVLWLFPFADAGFASSNLGGIHMAFARSAFPIGGDQPCTTSDIVYLDYDSRSSGCSGGGSPIYSGSTVETVV